MIFEMIADGRLHLSAVVMLAPYLTEDSAADLLPAAIHKTKLQLQHLLAERYPQPDMPSRVEALTSAAPILPQAPGPVGEAQPVVPQAPECYEQAPGPVENPPVAEEPAALRPPAPAPNPRGSVKPLAPGRYGIQFTMSQSAHDKLCYLQDLLGFALPSGDLGQLFEEALDARIREVEKQKLAATNHLEVARGGEATVSDIRLRCWAHNQYAAECTFGGDFMRHKRTAAAERRAARSLTLSARLPRTTARRRAPRAGDG